MFRVVLKPPKRYVLFGSQRFYRNFVKKCIKFVVVFNINFSDKKHKKQCPFKDNDI